MAATRKLQGEIERCLKKVTEGVDTFEDIWQKVHNATNSNQKEKYEADLKKEIKKLQRLRDQIKSWIASAEIKDKSTLLDYRKLIETQMERFKVVERETKTKAYSKEGLGAAQKMDPAQKEREEISAWLIQSISALNLQQDQFESEIESLLAAKKKKLDKDKQDRMDELKSKLEKHRYHIRKLETLLRMLDNMSVEVGQIRSIKEDVEYYIEASQDPEFEGNEYLYDDIIGLEEVELSGVGNPSSATTDSNGSPTSITSSSPPPSPPLSTSQTLQQPTSNATSTTSALHNNHTGEIPTTIVADEKRLPQKTAVVKPTAVRASNSANNVLNCSNNSNSSSNSSKAAPINKSASFTSTTAPSAANNSSNVSPSPILAQQPPPQVTHASNFAAVAAQHNSNKISGHVTENGVHVPSGPQHVAPPPGAIEQPVPQHSSTPVPLLNSSAAESSSSPPSSVSSAPSPAPVPPPTPPPAPSIPTSNVPASVAAAAADSTLSTLKSIAQSVIDRAGLEIPSSEPPRTAVVNYDKPNNTASNINSNNNPNSNSNSNNTGEAHIPPLLGVAPLGPVPLQKEHQCQFQMMEAAYYHMPHPADSERIRSYLPRTPCPTPVYYQQTPLPHSDTLEFFQRLSTETLFFIFYYMEGTKAQYLAAKSLKKQSWRFHTKYMMWFQRHEEPKLINEEYEQGTYIYFDYEKWGQRKKEGFTFEYKYLEDRDLN
ncbi:Not1 N-terminal domain, CCR4-Not complex component [Nesidiocoris tenuis]|uniref:Not1 N-terminal domain, CCR4-Not complex component n=1 Tax=Nesidiocoris tenuis TaxID=355587 RepID=A0ABN7ATJ5_9HEMI|nr:Not1 N-terminal domain, CCR4-Not complex component [Nesidiocoris tenuis]